MTGEKPPMTLDALAAAARESGEGRLPPVHLWNPPFCGDIDMRIAADGTWFYNGTPIGRPAMVRLFSTILKREGDAYFLVTPVEKCGIRVDDAPFAAVEMRSAPGALDFRTNVGDWIACGPGHGMRFVRQANGGYVPYLHVRNDLWARVMRSVYYDLVELGEIRNLDDGAAMFGIASRGDLYKMCDASELGETP